MKLYIGTVKGVLDWKVHVAQYDEENIFAHVRNNVDLASPLSMSELDLRLDIVNKSPTGFSWGYSGSGPHQLAYALIADVYNVPKQKRSEEPLVSHLLANALTSELTGVIGQRSSWVISDTIVRTMVEKIGRQLEKLTGGRYEPPGPGRRKVDQLG